MLYIAYGKDGLPMYVETNLQTLSQKVGVTANNISKCIGKGSPKYAKVKYKEGEDDT